MILPISLDAPILIRDGAATILFAHIGGAAVGLVSGGVAMAFRKGERPHRAAGAVFFVSMLTMSGIGAAVAPFLPREQAPNTLAGVITFYLVATGWVTVRRKAGAVGVFEVGAFLAAVCAAAAGAAWVWVDAHTPGAVHGPSDGAISIFAAVAALAAVCDLRVILRGRVHGAGRIARYLWRMSVALLIAAGSFAGQPKAIPEFLRGSPLLFLPMVAVLGLMIFWLLRVRFTRRFKALRGDLGALGGAVGNRPARSHA